MGGLAWLVNGVLSALFPRTCVMCDAEGQILCSLCAKKVRIPAWHVQKDQEGIEIFSRVSYKEKAVQHLLHAWKYRGDISAGEWWKKWICEEGQAPQDFVGAIFVPVPLAREAYAERGFNQAEILAKALATKYEGRVGEFLGRFPRKAQAKTEKEYRGKAREQNPYYKEQLFIQAQTRGQVPKSIILVDDVVTTGATMLACADTLRNAGVEKIFAVTLAYGNDA